MAKVSHKATDASGHQRKEVRKDMDEVLPFGAMGASASEKCDARSKTTVSESNNIASAGDMLSRRRPKQSESYLFAFNGEARK
jgi:hypothetical protein